MPLFFNALYFKVFWIGDYNYRVALSRDLVLRVFENADSDLYPSRFEQVLKKDQVGCGVRILFIGGAIEVVSIANVLISV